MVSVRLSGRQVAALDALAAQHGGSRSVALRCLIEEATPGRPAGRFDRDGVLEVLEQHARAGSVPAARELLRHLPDPELDRLNALARGDAA